jgi:hypothetical protein
MNLWLDLGIDKFFHHFSSPPLGIGAEDGRDDKLKCSTMCVIQGTSRRRGKKGKFSAVCNYNLPDCLPPWKTVLALGNGAECFGTEAQSVYGMPAREVCSCRKRKNIYKNVVGKV